MNVTNQGRSISQGESAKIKGNQATDNVAVVKDSTNKIGQTLLNERELAIEIYSAVMKNRKVRVVKLIDQGAQINTVYQNYWTLLQVAALEGFVDIVEVLLDNGAEVNAVNCDQDTALHLAAENGHKRVVELLVAAKADISKAGNHGYTTLHKACLSGNADLVSMLMDQGADVNRVANIGSTPLHVAAIRGNIKMAQNLLDRKAEINVVDKIGNTPLSRAARKRGDQSELWHFLKSRGADEKLGGVKYKKEERSADENLFSEIIEVFDVRTVVHERLSEEQVLALLENGRDFYRNKQYEKTFEALKKVVRQCSLMQMYGKEIGNIEKACIEGHLLLGVMFFLGLGLINRNIGSARMCFDEVYRLRLSTWENTSACYWLGNILQYSSNFKEAKEYYLEAIGSASVETVSSQSSARASLELGRMLIRIKEKTDALKYFDIAESYFQKVQTLENPSVLDCNKEDAAKYLKLIYTAKEKLLI